MIARLQKIVLETPTSHKNVPNYEKRTKLRIKIVYKDTYKKSALAFFPWNLYGFAETTGSRAVRHWKRITNICKTTCPILNQIFCKYSDSTACSAPENSTSEEQNTFVTDSDWCKHIHTHHAHQYVKSSFQFAL